MNEPVYLGVSLLKLSKIIMYEFWYDYVKPKYGGKAKFCYMDIDSFIVQIKTDVIYKDIAKDVYLLCSNYELNRPLPRGRNQKVI